MKKLVIFDLDGTLLYTLEDLHASTNFALEGEGLPGRSLDEVRRFVGNGIRKLIERGDWRAAAILGSITLPMLSKHVENLERIKEGKELKLDFLWDRDGELDRIGFLDAD